ncbi:myrcene synthase [Quercus suber]|uniref:Myrcene synthase n=1 Tax=Quercus suber TaxID=58331 RepID=A0AAW0M8K0_QUESU
MAASKISNSPIIVWRSTNYHPSIWHYNYIQSLRNEYVGETCTGQSNMLKESVRMMIHKVNVRIAWRKLEIFQTSTLKNTSRKIKIKSFCYSEPCLRASTALADNKDRNKVIH